MKLNLIIFMLNLVITLNSILYVHCNKRPKTFVSHALNVLGHIRPLVRKNISMQHITIIGPNGFQIRADNLFPENGDEYDFKQVLNNLSHLVNFRYMEIILTFNTLLSNILQKCENESNKTYDMNFVDLTLLVQTAVKNSEIVFTKLLNVIKFLRQLEEITRCYANQLFTIENVMTLVRNRLNVIGKSHLILDQMEDNSKILLAFQLFGDLKKLQLNLQEISEKFCGHISMHAVVNFDSIPFNFISFYNTELIDYFKDSNFHFNTDMMNVFFQKIVEWDYEDIGFEELLYPINPNLMFPEDEFSVKERYALSLYSKICGRSGWNSLNYIFIKNEDEWMNVEQTIRSEVDMSNIDIKYQNILMFLKCRYMEIIKNLITIFSFLTEICFKEKNDNGISNQYINCVKSIHTSFNESYSMLNCMSFAMETMRESRPKPKARTSNIPAIEKLIMFLMEYISSNKDNLYSEATSAEDLFNAADKYFVDFCYLIENIKVKHLNTLERHHAGYCDIRRKEFNRNDMLAALKDTIVNEFCNSLYETVKTNDFKNLGFSLTTHKTV